MKAVRSVCSKYSIKSLMTFGGEPLLFPEVVCAIYRTAMELGIPEGSGNVIFPSGNALNYLSEYFDESTGYINLYEDDPRDIRAISFSPEGEVLNGNIHQKDILEILDEYMP